MRRTDPSAQRMDGLEFAVRIKGNLTAAWSLIMCGTDLVLDGRFVECFEFIDNDFFSFVEVAMGGAVEALITFEEKCKQLSAHDPGIEWSPSWLFYSCKRMAGDSEDTRLRRVVYGIHKLHLPAHTIVWSNEFLIVSRHCYATERKTGASSKVQMHRWISFFILDNCIFHFSVCDKMWTEVSM